MRLTDQQITTILSIIRIFETGKASGDPSAVAVLDDGAGISYGIAQFTHRSGSLAVVVGEYLERGGTVAREALSTALPAMRLTTTLSIERLSADTTVKNALVLAGRTPEMREAQGAIAERLYLGPAKKFCEGREFELPLSLAVVYDSMVHGSFDRIANSINITAEKPWITEYVRRRDKWLASVPRLAKTRYRTRFFLNQIAIGNWQLALPLNVNGHKIAAPVKAQQSSAAVAPIDIKELAESAIHAFDTADAAVTGFARRADSVRSMWTAVGGTLWQAAWAVIGFAAGIPRTFWLVAAAMTTAILLLYLYRQIALGKIREQKN